MEKYKTGLVKEHREKTEYEKNQEELKKQYHIEDENVVIVEKDDHIKFFIRLFISFIKTACAICITLLAALGIISLIYPAIREELIVQLFLIKDQVLSYFQ